MKPPLSFSASNASWYAWGLFPAILLVYLLFPTKNYYWDGIFFARVIEDATGFTTSLLHPNHLLYNFFGYVVYKCAQALGVTSRAVAVLQVANSVVSVMTAALLFRSLRRNTQSLYLAWTLTLLFAFSATWWKFSTDANAYVLSSFFLLLAFSFLEPNAKPRLLIVALIFSIAVLVHQLAILCYPVIALGVWWQASSSERSIWKVIQFCGWAFFFVAGTYCFCFYLVSGGFNPARFASWTTSYSPDASFSFNLLSNLSYKLRGQFRLFFSGRFSLLRGLLRPQVILLIGILLVLVLAWLFQTLRGLQKTSWSRFLQIPGGRLAKLCALWIVVFVAFLFFWLPQNTFYRLLYLPAVMLLLGELLACWSARETTKRNYRLALFVAIMALANFLFFIFPYSHAEKFPPLSAALEMNSIWQPGTIVFYASENSDNNLFQYFNRATNWKPLPQLEKFEADLRKTHDDGKDAWLDASAIAKIKETPAGEEWLAQHSQPETLRERLDRGYNIRFLRVIP